MVSFCDLPTVYSTDFLFPWLKEDNKIQIHIETNGNQQKKLYFNNEENSIVIRSKL